MAEDRSDIRRERSRTADVREILIRVWHLLIRPTGRPAPAPPALRVQTVGLIVGLFVIWRGAILIASIAWGRLGVANAWSGDDIHHPLVRYSMRWDSGWYLGVVRDGYSYFPDQQSNIAFFPAFPYLARLFDPVLPFGDVFAGMVVVHLALLGAMLYLFHLVRIDYPESVAWRTLVFFLVFPAAIFFSAFYAESLIVFGMAGTVYHARRGQWLRAGLFGAFTGLTKLIGIVVMLPVILEMLRQGDLQRASSRAIAGLALVPAGAVAYLGYLHVWLGDFRTYFWTQEHWQRESFNPEALVMLTRMIRTGDPGELPYPGDVIPLHNLYFLMDVGTLMLFLVAGIYLWWRVLPGYGALVLAGALVPGLSGTPLALARHMAILFPVFILLGKIESEPVRNALTIVSVFGFGFTTYLFVNGYWAG